jgi:hypothetical protein
MTKAIVPLCFGISRRGGAADTGFTGAGTEFGFAGTELGFGTGTELEVSGFDSAGAGTGFFSFSTGVVTIASSGGAFGTGFFAAECITITAIEIAAETAIRIPAKATA